MTIGDALVAVCMERRGISPADFALNYPAGSLGKQLTLTAADLMVPVSKLHPLQPQTPLPEVFGGLTRDGIGTGWVSILTNRAPWWDCSPTLICAGPCRTSAPTAGAARRKPI